MLLLEHTLDFARKALQSSIAERKVASERLERGRSSLAEGAIERACDKMRQHIITLARDVAEARQNLEFFDWLLSSPIRNAEVLTALAEKLLSLADGAQNVEQSNVKEAPEHPPGGFSPGFPILLPGWHRLYT